MTLDPDDPFEAVLVEMADLARRKRADYADDIDVLGNFHRNATQSLQPDASAFTDCFSMITRKIDRTRNLVLNGDETAPANETLEDTLLDLAVYSVLLLMCWREGS